MKISTIILAVASLTGLVSCYPVVPYEGGPTQKKAPATAAQQAEAKKKAIKKAAQKKKQAAINALEDNTPGSSATGTSEVGNPTTPTQPKPELTKPKVIKYAAMVPGKEGFVFNPYTQNQVDVRGIPSGTKVRDPHDANPAHIFRVP